MNVVVLRAVTAIDAVTAFARISDFAQYPALTDAVVAVEVDDTDDLHTTSTWTVKFRRGLLRWTERDYLNADTGTIEFEQTVGDFASFTGTWRVHATDSGAAIEFSATFDLGMPSLADILHPLAATTLRDNIADILHGLLAATVIDLEPHRIP